MPVLLARNARLSSQTSHGNLSDRQKPPQATEEPCVICVQNDIRAAHS